MENRDLDEFLEEDIGEVIELNDDNNNVEFDDSASGDENEINYDQEMIAEPTHDQNGHLNGAGSSHVDTDQSIFTFKKHSGEIFTLDIGSNDTVTTGGEDDRAYVWKFDTGEVIFECTGHKDSVVCVKYNSKKSLLATADLSGIIQVWKTDDFSKVQEFQIDCDLEWLCWHHNADILFCGGSDSAVWMWLVPAGNCKIYAGHGPSCSSASLFPDGKRLCAGYGDGVVKIWDLKESNSVTVNGASCHTESITCTACHPDNSIACSGAEDGLVNIFHASGGKIIESIICAKKRTNQNQTVVERPDTMTPDEEASISVESLAFCQILPLLSAGVVTGDLIIWDLNARQIRQQFRHPDGIVKAAWHDSCLFTTCVDGRIRLWDSRSGSMVREWSGHSKEILDFALSEDGKYLITASGDQTSKLFPLNS